MKINLAKEEKVQIAQKRGLSLFKRGTIDVLTEDALIDKLASKEKLLVKFGIDPTTPDMHLGHTVSLTKVRQLQDIGHQCVLIIGDFTATIGDPSGRKVTRPKLTYGQVKENMEGYIGQISRIVDVKNLIIHYNSEWLSDLKPLDFLDIFSKATVQQLLERRDFTLRMAKKQPLSVSELIYPLMVGYDSVKLKADVELGGTDQLFNFVMSREMQKAFGQEPEVILTLPLLEGTDGKMKMSKSYGNAINVDEEPVSMYMKIMSIDDTLMLRYYELLSLVGDEELDGIKLSVTMGHGNPMECKMNLAYELTERYHGKADASRAQDYFNEVVRRKTAIDPDKIDEYRIDSSQPNMNVMDLLSCILSGKSKGEIRRLITQGAVALDQKKLADPFQELNLGEIDGSILKVGKKAYYKLATRSG